jgi:hypothetical protein
MMRRLRAHILIFAVALLSTGAAAGGLEQPTTATASLDGETLRWAVTQGGLVVVILVVIWSYRRDFQRVFVEEQGRTRALMQALERTNMTLATHAEASRAQAEAFQRAAQSIHLCEAVRQMLAERTEREP